MISKITRLTQGGSGVEVSYRIFGICVLKTTIQHSLWLRLNQ